MKKEKPKEQELHPIIAYNSYGLDGVKFRKLLIEIEFDLHTGRKQEKLLKFIKSQIEKQETKLLCEFQDAEMFELRQKVKIRLVLKNN